MVLAGGKAVAAVAPRPTTSARNTMLLPDRFAVVAQGIVVIHVPVRRRVLGVVGVKRRLVRHCLAPLGVPLGHSLPRAAHDLHVLLRHRLLLQAEVGEGAVAVQVEEELDDLPVVDVE